MKRLDVRGPSDAVLSLPARLSRLSGLEGDSRRPPDGMQQVSLLLVERPVLQQPVWFPLTEQLE